METGIRIPGRGGAGISTIGIPFPVSTRIHTSGDYIDTLNAGKKADIREGLAGGF
jgi:hypothetical protein